MTIIIPTCKRSNLQPCLESVLEYSSEKVLVIANGFDDRKYLDDSGVRYIWFDDKIGYTKAINIGINSTNDDIILLNDDVIILPQPKDQWINQLKQYDYSGVKKLTCDVTGRSFLLFFCVFIKRKVFDKIGLPDEIFNPGFAEDIDFAIRAEDAGFEQTLVSVNLYHKGGDTVHTVPQWEGIVQRNKNILREKYKIVPKERFAEVQEIFKKQDKDVYNEIFTGFSSYELSPVEFKNSVVFDFGANVGMFSVFALQSGAKEVVAVEAHPVYYKTLTENVKNFPEIKTVNRAIYHLDDEHVKFSDEKTGSTISKDGFDVTTITLSTLLKQYPDEKNMILKMDCEGAEWNIVFNSSEEELRRFKVISCEVHEHMNVDPKYRGSGVVEEKLKSLGFKNWSMKPIFYWDVDMATGKTSNMRPLGLVIEKWVREEKAVIPEVIVPTVTPTIIPAIEEKITETHKNEAPTSRIIVPKKLSVAAVIPTKDRYYSTLPLTIQAVISQTVKPDKIIILDDTDNPIDIRTLSIYRNLIMALEEKGIAWYIIYALKKGAHYSHQISQDMADDLVWRIDDDEVPNPNVLEVLLSNMAEGVGAVGGLVLMPGATHKECANNPISDVSTNCQWFKWSGKKEVEHLYSSFLYRKGITDYELSLSKAAHREETIFSHRIFKKGYKLIVDSNAVTMHYRNDEGGIRNSATDLFAHDEKIYNEIKKEWDGEIICYLDNGKGDHVVFKSILPEIKAKYKKVTIACCYPDLFPGENTISITKGNEYVTPDRFNLYKFMSDRQWKTEMVDAFRKMYLDI